jgi:hypothetical protein
VSTTRPSPAKGEYASDSQTAGPTVSRTRVSANWCCTYLGALLPFAEPGATHNCGQRRQPIEWKGLARWRWQCCPNPPTGLHPLVIEGQHQLVRVQLASGRWHRMPWQLYQPLGSLHQVPASHSFLCVQHPASKADAGHRGDLELMRPSLTCVVKSKKATILTECMVSWGCSGIEADIRQASGFPSELSKEGTACNSACRTDSPNTLFAFEEVVYARLSADVEPSELRVSPCMSKKWALAYCELA